MRKYLVFPITYLILDLAEDFVYYKCELIEDFPLRVLVVMVSLVLGISLLAFMLVPFLEGGLETVRKSNKQHGSLANLILTLALLFGLYFVYYVKMQGGIENILPPFALN